MSAVQENNSVSSSVAAEVSKMKISDAKKDAGNGHPLEKDPAPEYIAHRIRMFDELKAKYDAEVATKSNDPIKIALADGRIMEGLSWKTHPMEIAKLVDPSLPDRLVISKVNGELWDCTRPLEQSCTLEFIDFDCLNLLNLLLFG